MNVNRTISSLVRISLVLPAVVSLSMSACTESVRDAHIESALPDIYPDYHGVTVPVNIAPLNFSMSADGYRKIDAVVTDSDGRKIHGQGDESTSFNLDQWHELLSQNVGDSLYVTVSAKDDDGWHTYASFSGLQGHTFSSMPAILSIRSKAMSRSRSTSTLRGFVVSGKIGSPIEMVSSGSSFLPNSL